MGLTGLAATVRDVGPRVAAAPVLAGLLALLFAGPWVPAAFGRSSSALYYETETRAGQVAIDRLNLSGARSITQVVDLGDVNVFGIALAGSNVYWSTEAGPSDRGAIMRATRDGQNVRRLVGGLPAPASVIAVGGFVSWSDENAIGRMALDGSRVRRRFIVLPQEQGGGVADGLASDGTHLYFTRCGDDTIGRAGLDGRHIDLRFISLGPKSCPQGVSVGGRQLYWTELGSGTIGRATLNGDGIDGRWLNIHSNQVRFRSRPTAPTSTGPGETWPAARPTPGGQAPTGPISILASLPTRSIRWRSPARARFLLRGEQK
jgi:hypothetical protein